MKLVADNNGRICSAELFPPRTAFDASRQPDGSVRLVELAGKEAPLVKPVRTPEGFLMLPVRASRQAIRSAIRADRDARTVSGVTPVSVLTHYGHKLQIKYQ